MITGSSKRPQDLSFPKFSLSPIIGSGMSTDFDPLDELFPQAAKSARAGGKFQPKVKPRPRNNSSIKQPSSQHVQNIKSADSEIEKPSESNSDSGVLSLNNSSLANSSSECLNGETLGDNLADGVLPDIDLKPIGEEALMNSNVDPLDEIFSGHVAKNARGGAKFPPKNKPRPRKETTKKQSSLQPVHKVAGNELEAPENKSYDNLGLQVDAVTLVISEELEQGNADTVVGSESFDEVSDQATITTASETPFVHVSETSNTVEGSPIPDVLISEGSVIGLSNFTFPQDEVVSDCDVDFHFNDGVLETEEIETECLESIFDMTTQSGQRSQKIQPTPKFQIDTRKNDATASHPDGSEFVSCFENDDYICEFIPHEDLTGPAVSSFPDASCTSDHLSGFPETLEKSAELRKRKTSMVCDDSLGHQEASISGQDNETSISTRKMRKRINTYALGDENEDEAHDVANLGNEHPGGSLIEEENHNDGESEVENETQTEKKRKRSKKASSRKEKPVCKRKNVNEAPDQATQKPHKKFSHSTRRNKRQVDKVLLETPEDEIDMRKLRIRDIILLAEHRERAASKVEEIAEPTSADKSAGTSFADVNDDSFEGEDFASERGQFSNDQPQNSSIFNYHSHMKKTPRSRWSNQDTELFYKGVRQFGSDISMIQQLFPDRTRAQVKLKYKKEERQQPLRLHDALTNRLEDHSHFRWVIEQLKQLAAQENLNSFEDDSVDLTGNGEEVNPEINEKVDNLEKVEEREDEGMEPDPSEAQSPLKPSYDSDDDLSTWCQYKSEL